MYTEQRVGGYAYRSRDKFDMVSGECTAGNGERLSRYPAMAVRNYLASSSSILTHCM